MNGSVSFAYVNKKFYEDSKGKTRLTVLCSNSVGKDQYKKYINYSVTLWEEEAVYWNKIITGEKDSKQCVSFSGYITDVSGKESNGKIYTTVQLNLAKAGKTSAFFLLPNLGDTSAGGSANAGNTGISEEDF